MYSLYYSVITDNNALFRIPYTKVENFLLKNKQTVDKTSQNQSRFLSMSCVIITLLIY